MQLIHDQFLWHPFFRSSQDITVAFNSTPITTNESSRYVTVCVGILTGVLGRNASVYLSTVDGTAIKSSKPDQLEETQILTLLFVLQQTMHLCNMLNYSL